MSYYVDSSGNAFYKRYFWLDALFSHPLYFISVMLIVIGIVSMFVTKNTWLTGTTSIGGLLLLGGLIAYDYFDPFTPQEVKEARKAKEAAQEAKFQEAMRTLDKNDAEIKKLAAAYNNRE